MSSGSGDRRQPRLDGSGGSPPENEAHLPCPRCYSPNTKFCYYNNYNLSQPRYFCKSCRRYWTKGGTLRNIPVGGGSRKNAKRSRTASSCAGSEDAKSTNPGPTRGKPDVSALSFNVPGSFTSLLNSQSPPGLSGLGQEFGFGLEEIAFGHRAWPWTEFGEGCGGAPWQLSSCVDGDFVVWPELAVSAPTGLN